VLNIDKIFSLFPSASKDPNADVDNSLDFNENPLTWVKMFMKIVSNHVVYKNEIIASFTKTEINGLDTNDVEKAGEFIAYNRAWIYLSKLNIKKTSHLDALYANTDEGLIKMLKAIGRYFQQEGVEEYEKCAFIKNILDKVKIYYKKFGSLKKI